MYIYIYIEASIIILSMVARANAVTITTQFSHTFSKKFFVMDTYAHTHTYRVYIHNMRNSRSYISLPNQE